MMRQALIERSIAIRATLIEPSECRDKLFLFVSSSRDISAHSFRSDLKLVPVNTTCFLDALPIRWSQLTSPLSSETSMPPFEPLSYLHRIVLCGYRKFMVAGVFHVAVMPSRAARALRSEVTIFFGPGAIISRVCLED
jgi:hypothetical protein